MIQDNHAGTRHALRMGQSGSILTNQQADNRLGCNEIFARYLSIFPKYYQILTCSIYFPQILNYNMTQAL